MSSMTARPQSPQPTHVSQSIAASSVTGSKLTRGSVSVAKRSSSRLRRSFHGSRHGVLAVQLKDVESHEAGIVTDRRKMPLPKIRPSARNSSPPQCRVLPDSVVISYKGTDVGI